MRRISVPSAIASATSCTTRGCRSMRRCCTPSRRPTGGALAAMTTEAGLRVALCVARFYSELAAKLEAGAREALSEAGVSDVQVFDVPGAFELPLAAKYAAASGRFAAVICLGAVIRGATDHYAYVCAEAARGIQ